MWPESPWLQAALAVLACGPLGWLAGRWWREPDPWFGWAVLATTPCLSAAFLLAWLIGL